MFNSKNRNHRYLCESCEVYKTENEMAFISTNVSVCLECAEADEADARREVNAEFDRQYKEGFDHEPKR